MHWEEGAASFLAEAASSRRGKAETSKQQPVLGPRQCVRPARREGKDGCMGSWSEGWVQTRQSAL